MANPIIGVNTSLLQLPEGGMQFYLYAEYVDAISHAGGTPVLLPATANLKDARKQLKAIDGLLLTGGGDPNSKTWGEALHPKANLMLPRRDAYDIELCRAAIRQRIPVLGICSGQQCISLACGGSLHQHLYDVYKKKVRHHGCKTDPAAHKITIQPGTQLAAIMGGLSYKVNSSHHQSVAHPGRGIRVSAVCPTDGVIEAVEHKNPERFVLGVQWHPEVTGSKKASRALFSALALAARRFNRLKDT